MARVPKNGRNGMHGKGAQNLLDCNLVCITTLLHVFGSYILSRSRLKKWISHINRGAFLLSKGTPKKSLLSKKGHYPYLPLQSATACSHKRFLQCLANGVFLSKLLCDSSAKVIHFPLSSISYTEIFKLNSESQFPHYFQPVYNVDIFQTLTVEVTY